MLAGLKLLNTQDHLWFLLGTFPAPCLCQALLRLGNSPDYIKTHLLLLNFLANVFVVADGEKL